MGTKTKAMFVTQQEFVDWVRDAQAQISNCAVFCYGVGRSMVVWQGSDEELSAASRLYIAERDPSRSEPTVESLNEEGIGWVQMDVPRVVDETLRLCQIGTKSDWWNKTLAVSQENSASLRFFDKVWRVLRPHLAFPVWATNIRTGASSQYKAIGYSPGAARWQMQGGSLGQEGVEFIKYEIRQ